MADIASLIVKITADVDNAIQGLEKTQKGLNNVADTIKDVGTKMTTFVTLPILAAATASFKFASDINETFNKVDVAFKDSSKSVMDWSKTTLNAYGIAQGTALDMAALFGDMSTSMGISTEEAAKMSTSLVGLAGDLASFKNIGIDQATTALKSIFTGETESLKNLGVIMNETTLKEYAMSKGIEKSYTDMSQAEKVALRYQFVIDATKNSQGDFARTSDGAANQMRIFAESLKQVSTSFGQVLLPIITPIIQKFNEFLTYLQSLDKEQLNFILIIAGVVAAIGPVLLIFAGMINFILDAQMAFAVLSVIVNAAGGSFALLTTFVLPIIAGIVALIAVGYLLYKNWDLIISKSTELYELVTDEFGKLFVDIKSIFWNIWITVQNVWNELYKTISVYVDLIMKFVKFGLDSLSSFWNEWGTEITNLTSAVLGIIYGTIQTIIYIIKDVISFFLAFIRGDWESAFNYIYDIVVKIFNWIHDVVFSGMDKVRNAIYDIFQKIDMNSLGSNLISGLWNGIQDAASWLWNKLTDLANKIKDTFAKILQIHSPSKVFIGFGENIAEGLAVGIKSAESLATNASVDMAYNVQNNVDDFDNNNNRNNSNGVNQTIIINAPTELNPMEVARQTNKLARQLAVGLY